MSKQSRRKFLQTMGSAAVSASSLSILSGLGQTRCSGASRKRPNVVLIMTDDQGYGDLSCHGSPYVKTPTLDGLHRESVRLTNFHVDPCCSPTRASLLTGQYSARTGVWHTIGGRSLLAADKTTMADVFRANGYRTGVFGKWHLGDNYPFRPQDRGFEETVVHRSGTVGTASDPWGNDYNDDTYLHNGRPRKYEGYCNSVWFAEAARFIRENRGNPFFCYLPTNLPHAPLTVDETYAAPYRAEVSERLAAYYGMLTKFDEDLAGLLREIETLGLGDDTILIFMSDNGPCPWYGGIVIDDDGFPVEGYSAGMRGGKIWGYENAHRVPCFIRWPGGGIGGGKDVGRLAAHFDLLPTLVDLCGLKAPGGLELDGKSLVPLLHDSEGDWPERTLLVHNQRVDFPEKYKEFQVLTERWRLVNRHHRKVETADPSAGEDLFETDPDRFELYDIIADPGQRTHVSGSYPDVVRDLFLRYEEWWQDVSRGFDEYCEIVVGSDRENPATLFSHDAHRSGRGNVWVIRVAQDGEYTFALSRWPRESGKRILENRDGAATSDSDIARLVIGNLEAEAPLTEATREAEFTLHLRAGTTCLQGQFAEEDGGKTIQADYVRVERVGPADPTALGRYTATNPDDLLKARAAPSS